MSTLHFRISGNFGQLFLDPFLSVGSNFGKKIEAKNSETDYYRFLPGPGTPRLRLD